MSPIGALAIMCFDALRAARGQLQCFVGPVRDSIWTGVEAGK